MGGRRAVKISSCLFLCSIPSIASFLSNSESVCSILSAFLLCTFSQKKRHQAPAPQRRQGHLIDNAFLQLLAGSDIKGLVLSRGLVSSSTQTASSNNLISIIPCFTNVTVSVRCLLVLLWQTQLWLVLKCHVRLLN